MEETGPEQLRFSLLGPMRAWRGTAELELGSPQQRAVLAMLLLRRGHAVGVADLVDGIWGTEPPPGAVSVLRTYISRLRRLLEPERAPGQPSHLLLSVREGYALRTDGVSSDVAECKEAVTLAERHRAAGEVAAALRLLSTALAAWESPALAGVPGPYAEISRTELAERHLGALEFRLRLELELGRHKAAVPELLALRDAHPLRETLSELLLVALYRSGRQAEALEAYARTRRTLVDELGVEPGPSLRALHARLLAGDPDLLRPPPRGPGVEDERERPGGPDEAASADEVDTAAPHRTGTLPGPTPGDGAPARRGATVRPSQLPADLATFTGRRAELAQASALPADGDRAGTAASAIGVIDGMAGAGKSTLAVHWAHRVAHRFPDGSLYVDLHGYDPGGARMDPGEAIATFLVALGVAPHDVPEGLDAQAALYRSVLADRRVLIVLDNARDTEQVRPLLPGASGCLVIVTSRSRLTGLVAQHGAYPLTLGLLSAEDARELLVQRLGGDRVDAEPEAADAIVDLCARLPLALAIVAARAAHHPGFRLADIAAELRRDHGSLDAFAGQETGSDVRAVFSWSYRALSPEAAGLFRRLTLHPGPAIAAATAAAPAGVPRRRVRALLSELTGANLLIERVPGRFVLHDLLRAYARELIAKEDSPQEREAAQLRLLDHCLHTADHASAVLGPFDERIPLPPCTPGSEPLRFDDGRQATAWLRTERHVLRAIVEYAADQGHYDHAWRIAFTLDPHFDRLGYRHDLMEINKAALHAARALGDPIGQAHALRGLGFCHTRFDHPDEAVRLMDQALELFRQAGDALGQARTHRCLAHQADRLGRYDDSLDHYVQAGELYQSLGHRSGEAGILNDIGWTYIRLDAPEHALEHCAKSVSLLQQAGDLNGEAAAQDSIGWAQHLLGRYDAAVERFEAAIGLYRELDNRYMEADTLRHLGDSHRAVGDHESARTAWAAALALLAEGGHAEADEVRQDLRELDAGERGPGAADARDRTGYRRPRSANATFRLRRA
ncbi:AfsR/SARP family transcriptional regulator [Streptomyces pseudovenezuelae]|uniref:DNA-binding SARP family transcriptional activator n=1 Tax=Streptomyces pseudovenezuelae TaxID=67350 RepID=A0ABT6LQ69_9ACTN|nr:BTAD domain-containing putative transcriptional regulator [Streptomyces pseudovenezuelae]MDH6218452.1 DNA-binding SARP family transcriptional activator [Streptomyces pseudovenezuelae]